MKVREGALQIGIKGRKSLVLAAVKIFCLSRKCHHQKSIFAINLFYDCLNWRDERGVELKKKKERNGQQTLKV